MIDLSKVVYWEEDESWERSYVRMVKWREKTQILLAQIYPQRVGPVLKSKIQYRIEILYYTPQMEEQIDFDTPNAAKKMLARWLVGNGFTTVSEQKARQYSLML